MDYNRFLQKNKLYALYIHGFGSGAASGTKSAITQHLTHYEWLCPEVTHDPYTSMPILDEWIQVFQPQLIVGTSMGGFYTMFVKAPNAIKIAINPALNIESVMRKIGYGKYKYFCPREDGETEYVIDETLCRKFIQFRSENTIQQGLKNMALFSTVDELVGHENSKKNAKIAEQAGFEILWNDKFGHRLNSSAAKVIHQWLNI